MFPLSLSGKEQCVITIEQANQIWKENILKTDTLDNAMAKTMQDVYQKGLEDRLQEKREV